MTSEWLTKITLYLASSNVNNLANHRFIVRIGCVKASCRYSQKQANERVRPIIKSLAILANGLRDISSYIF